MWARLQGVGISVRADTALPWPLLLLHKTSQPALSPGLESVSAATCQIKTKREKETTLSLPSSSSCHHPSFSSSSGYRSFASSLMSCACGKTHHAAYYAFRQSSAAWLSHKLCLPFSLLPVLSQCNSSSIYNLFIPDIFAA